MGVPVPILSTGFTGSLDPRIQVDLACLESFSELFCRLQAMRDLFALGLGLFSNFKTPADHFSLGGMPDGGQFPKTGNSAGI